MVIQHPNSRSGIFKKAIERVLASLDHLTPPELAELQRMDEHVLSSALKSTIAMNSSGADDEFTKSIGPWAGGQLVGSTLKVTRQRLQQLRNSRKILAVKFPDGKFYYPTLQFRDGHVIPRLSEMLDALFEGAAESVTWATWLASPSPRSAGNRTMWDELRSADSTYALTLARGDAAGWAT